MNKTNDTCSCTNKHVSFTTPSDDKDIEGGREGRTVDLKEDATLDTEQSDEFTEDDAKTSTSSVNSLDTPKSLYDIEEGVEATFEEAASSFEASILDKNKSYTPSIPPHMDERATTGSLARLARFEDSIMRKADLCNAERATAGPASLSNLEKNIEGKVGTKASPSRSVGAFPVAPNTVREATPSQVGTVCQDNLMVTAELVEEEDKVIVEAETMPQQKSSNEIRRRKILCLLFSFLICVAVLLSLLIPKALEDSEIDDIITPEPGTEKESQSPSIDTLPPTELGPWKLRSSLLKEFESIDTVGSAVSLSSNGRVLAVGAEEFTGRGEANESLPWSGMSQIFEYIDETSEWAQRGQSLYGQKAADRMGTAVSLNKVGDRLVLSAPGHDLNRGMVKVLEWQPSASEEPTNGEWVQVGSSVVGTRPRSFFGVAADISDAGDVFAFVTLDADLPLSLMGETRVFDWDDVKSDWRQRPIVGDSNGQLAVALSSDGRLIAIGNGFWPIIYDDEGNFQDLEGKGKMSFFAWNQTHYVQLGQIEGSVPMGAVGRYVSMTPDGMTCVVSSGGFIGSDVRVYRLMRINGDSEDLVTIDEAVTDPTAFEWVQQGQTLVSVDSENTVEKGLGSNTKISSDGKRLVLLSSARTRTYEWNEADSLWSKSEFDILPSTDSANPFSMDMSESGDVLVTGTLGTRLPASDKGLPADFVPVQVFDWMSE